MRTLKRSAVLALAFTGIFAASARAEETLIAKIPFPFVVRGEVLPAGSYDIVEDQGLIEIRGNDVHVAAGAMAMGTPAGGKDPRGREPALVFIDADGRYMLSQVWESDEKGLSVVARSAKAKERHMAGLRPATESPTVIQAEHGK